MAFKLGRKLGKLDAICANLKLKQNGTSDSGEVEAEKSLRNGSPTPAADAPADLSLRSNNNNIIGKADLNSMDDDESGIDEGRTADEGLDYSIKQNHSAETMATQLSDLPAKAACHLPSSNDSKSEMTDDHSCKDSKADNKEKSSIELKQMVNAMREKRKCKAIPVGTSRRKSRKSTVPRSITQVRDMYDQLDDKDELSEYEINNQNTNFPPEDCEDSEKETSGSSQGPLLQYLPNTDRDSKQLQNHSQSFLHTRPTVISSVSTVGAAPLDLSVSKVRDIEEPVEDPDSEEEMETSRHEDSELIRNQVVRNEEKSLRIRYPPFSDALGGVKAPGGEQMNHLKDFAESTMNELISMYGFGGSHHNDPSKPVPTKTVKNLPPKMCTSPAERLSPGTLSLGGASLHSSAMSSGDEDMDHPTPNKGIYANYGKSSMGGPAKHGKCNVLEFCYGLKSDIL